MRFTAFGDSFAHGNKESFWDLARSAKHHLEPAQSIVGAKAMLGAVDGETAKALVADESEERPGRIFLFDCHISNLGVLPLAHTYGSISVESIWGPGVLLGFQGEQTLGVSTVNDSICLAHVSHDPI